MLWLEHAVPIDLDVIGCRYYPFRRTVVECATAVLRLRGAAWCLARVRFWCQQKRLYSTGERGGGNNGCGRHATRCGWCAIYVDRVSKRQCLKPLARFPLHFPQLSMTDLFARTPHDADLIAGSRPSAVRGKTGGKSSRGCRAESGCRAAYSGA